MTVCDFNFQAVDLVVYRRFMSLLNLWIQRLAHNSVLHLYVLLIVRSVEAVRFLRTDNEGQKTMSNICT